MRKAILLLFVLFIPFSALTESKLPPSVRPLASSRALQYYYQTHAILCYRFPSLPFYGEFHLQYFDDADHSYIKGKKVVLPLYFFKPDTFCFLLVTPGTYVHHQFVKRSYSTTQQTTVTWKTPVTMRFKLKAEAGTIYYLGDYDYDGGLYNMDVHNNPDTILTIGTIPYADNWNVKSYDEERCEEVHEYLPSGDDDDLDIYFYYGGEFQ